MIAKIGDGFSNAFLMAYEVWWALVLGFAISAIVQAWVPKERVEQSEAAHEEARRLDPHIASSLEQTLLMSGQYERLQALERDTGMKGGADAARIFALIATGRRDDALQLLTAAFAATEVPAFRGWAVYFQAWLQRDAEAMQAARDSMRHLKVMEDPEAVFYGAWAFCEAGHPERGLDYLRRAVSKGYFVAGTLRRNPVFDEVRSDPRFQEILADATAGRDQALVLFRDRRGERLLGRREAEVTP